MRAAIRFLTIVPVGGAGGPPSAVSLAAFPVVGMLVGLAWGLTAYGIEHQQLFVSTAVAAAAVLVVDAVLTGGLHLDALADVADGVASRRDAEQAVAIMRQPTIGAAGAAALVLACLLRYGLLITAVDFAARLVAVPVAGRAAMVLLLRVAPPPESGSLAAAFARPTAATLALAAALAVTGVWLPAGGRGLAALAGALATGVAWGRWWRRRFGALTGDGAGAGGLLSETVALVLVGLR